MADSQLSFSINGVTKTLDLRDILLKDSDTSSYNIIDIEGNVHASLSSFFRSLMNNADAGTILTNLGITSFVQGMLNDADATEVKATLGVDLAGLGVTTFIQTLTDDATALAARDTLLIPNKNYTIDPNFEIWPEGTSSTNATGNDFYGSVLMGGNSGTGGTPSLTLSRQPFTLGQTDVPREPKYFLRGDLTVAASVNQPYLYHKIESVRTNANGSITATAYLKSGAAMSVDIDYVQNFGTTGSPSADVIVTSQSQALTTSWTKIIKTFTIPSLSGKTIGTDDNDYLQLRVKYPLGATNTIDISSLKQEEGIVSTDMGIVDIGTELPKSQRYFEVNVGFGVALSSGIAGQGFIFSVAKRAKPNVTFYSTSHRAGTVGSLTESISSGVAKVVGNYVANTSSVPIIYIISPGINETIMSGSADIDARL
tara:strand:+ start:2655 stop:3932 length:1278 start_codon:yes stop_codon:yes gene_type:complete